MPPEIKLFICHYDNNESEVSKLYRRMTVKIICSYNTSQHLVMNAKDSHQRYFVILVKSCDLVPLLMAGKESITCDIFLVLSPIH